MAPEIFDMTQHVDPALVDAWGMGLVLFFIFENTHPFTEEQL